MKSIDKFLSELEVTPAETDIVKRLLIAGDSAIDVLNVKYKRKIADMLQKRENKQKEKIQKQQMTKKKPIIKK